MINQSFVRVLSCVVWASALFVSANAFAAPQLKQIADGFTSPLNLLSLDDGSGRLLVGDQVGTIWILNKDGKLDNQPFLDLRSKMVKLPQARMICLFNWGDEPRTLVARLPGAATIVDQWTGESIGRLATVSIAMAPRAARLLKSVS